MPEMAPPGKTPERGEKIVRRSYKVVGPHCVYGACTGDVVDLELTEGQESVLIESGHIAPAERTAVSVVKER